MADEAAAAEGAAPVVDGHAHVFTRTTPLAADAHARPDYDYTVDDWLAEMARHGLRYGVVAAASLHGGHNDHIISALAAYPDRLRGTVILPPDADARLLRDLTGRGVVGVRLTWRRLAGLPDIGADPWRSHLRALADAGLHVELLAGDDDLPVLLPALAESGVRVVVDHFGVPGRDKGAQGEGMDALLRAIDRGGTWVKISAGFRMAFETARDCTARLLAGAGAERLIWGSDAPFVNHEGSVDYAAALALYHRLVPDAPTRHAIDRTALDLYFT
nr:amidohydrolase family protein [Sphingomonas sp. Y57]